MAEAAAASHGLGGAGEGSGAAGAGGPVVVCARSDGRTCCPGRAGQVLVVAAPWYRLCYLKNGAPFVRTFFWEHHFRPFLTSGLQHPQPFWFYLPVLAGSLFPWTPVYRAVVQRTPVVRSAPRLSVGLGVFGLLFFSGAMNKLHGYILPLVPAAAALTGVALAKTAGRAVGPGRGSAALLCLVFPRGVDAAARSGVGVSRSDIPAWNLWWTLRWRWLWPFGTWKRGGPGAGGAVDCGYVGWRCGVFEGCLFSGDSNPAIFGASVVAAGRSG